ncbi:MAG: hypothetical protein CMF31_05830 [Kordiimonas sp.]|nr:hypothetical protein [Kordiimonas sp.]
MQVLFICDYALCYPGLRQLLDDLDDDVSLTTVTNIDDAELPLANNSFDLIISIFDPVCSFQKANCATEQDIQHCLEQAGDVSLLREQAKGAPVILFTFRESVHLARKVMANGAAAYIPLSSSRDVMLNALRLVLAGGRYIPPELLSGRWSEQDSQQQIVITTAQHEEDDHILTPRQRDVLNCMAERKSNKVIARELNVTEGTVKVHVAAILKALKAENRTHAVLLANQQNLT